MKIKTGHKSQHNAMTAARPKKEVIPPAGGYLMHPDMKE